MLALAATLRGFFKWYKDQNDLLCFVRKQLVVIMVFPEEVVAHACRSWLDRRLPWPQQHLLHVELSEGIPGKLGPPENGVGLHIRKQGLQPVSQVRPETQFFLSQCLFCVKISLGPLSDILCFHGAVLSSTQNHRKTRSASGVAPVQGLPVAKKPENWNCAIDQT